MKEQWNERYVNPYTDFGFKKLFGTELNKELLISLLNALFDRSAQQLPGEPKQVVKDLSYRKTCRGCSSVLPLYRNECSPVYLSKPR